MISEIENSFLKLLRLKRKNIHNAYLRAVNIPTKIVKIVNFIMYGI